MLLEGEEGDELPWTLRVLDDKCRLFERTMTLDDFKDHKK